MFTQTQSNILFPQLASLGHNDDSYDQKLCFDSFSTRMNTVGAMNCKSMLFDGKRDIYRDFNF